MSARQEEAVRAFIAELDDDARPMYENLLECLLALGYHAQKERSYFSFKHDLHRKQMAKMGLRNGKAPKSFFALRFSACRALSPRFEVIVAEAIVKSPSKTPGCLQGMCSFCRGLPETHIYTHAFADGDVRHHCGAYALEIPDMTPGDLPELAALIRQAHAYLLAEEAEA